MSFSYFAGNIYRLENHSTDVKAVLYWTVIKPISAERVRAELYGEEQQENMYLPAEVGGDDVGDEGDDQQQDYSDREEEDEDAEEHGFENDNNQHGVYA